MAGTNTPFATYTDSSGGVQNANPTVLSSDGRANIWWQSAAYKVVLAGGGTCASPSNLQWTVDNFQVGVFLNGNNSWTGNETHSGTETFTGALDATMGGELDGTFSGSPNFTGAVTFSGSLSITQLTLTQATGMPPLVVTSTTKVDNLNVSLLNGVSFPGQPKPPQRSGNHIHKYRSMARSARLYDGSTRIYSVQQRLELRSVSRSNTSHAHAETRVERRRLLHLKREFG